MVKVKGGLTSAVDNDIQRDGFCAQLIRARLDGTWFRVVYLDNIGSSGSELLSLG